MKSILGQYTVLYAEDDKEVQKSVVEYLNRYFKEVHIASDGKEALELYNKHNPNALIFDIDMPHIDGLALAKIVREKNKTVPILMLTAFTHTDKLLKATELNLTKYLVKPVDPMEFKKAIQKLSDALASSSSNFIELKDGFLWNKESKELLKDGTAVSFLQKEQVLLELLISKRNECVMFTDIMALVWEDDFDAEISIESVKFQVSMLRKKLPKDSIKNVYGKGYVLNS
jgi:DNA-binding response OmpR family regulator